MPPVDDPHAYNPNAVSDSNDIYDSRDLARDLMMPTGEPAVAVIGACLLLGMVWFLGSGHFTGASQPTHAAAATRPNLHASGGPIAPPASHRFAG
jgi:hypothetical protein